LPLAMMAFATLLLAGVSPFGASNGSGRSPTNFPGPLSGESVTLWAPRSRVSPKPCRANGSVGAGSVQR
jgi:hypothetical protein